MMTTPQVTSTLLTRHEMAKVELTSHQNTSSSLNHMNTDTANKIKLFFDLPSTEQYGTESMWAEPTSENTAVLLNSPFYAKGVSYLDEVRFVRMDDGGLHFQNVVKKSGHSTYRIMQLEEKQAEQFDTYWQPLEQLGCRYELQLTDKAALYSIDVPPSTDLSAVYSLLEKGESEGVWHFEEADHPAWHQAANQ